MKYSEIKEAVLAGAEARIESWASKAKKIRRGNVGDNDYIHFDNLEKEIVLDCPDKKCDCVICLYTPTKEEEQSEDWVIIK